MRFSAPFTQPQVRMKMHIKSAKTMFSLPSGKSLLEACFCGSIVVRSQSQPLGFCKLVDCILFCISKRNVTRSYFLISRCCSHEHGIGCQNEQRLHLRGDPATPAGKADPGVFFLPLSAMRRQSPLRATNICSGGRQGWNEEQGRARLHRAKCLIYFFPFLSLSKWGSRSLV